MKHLLKIIATGDKKSAKEARKEIERLWNHAPHPLSDVYLGMLDSIRATIKDFENTLPDDRQASLVSALRHVFVRVGDERFEEFGQFILKMIQHQSGKVRRAAVHAANYLVLPLGAQFFRDVADEQSLNRAEMEFIERSEAKYFDFVYTVELLIDKYHEPRFDKYEHLKSLPASVYKSLQELLLNVLLKTDKHEEAYNVYLKERCNTGTAGENSHEENNDTDRRDQLRYGDIELQVHKSQMFYHRQALKDEIKKVLHKHGSAHSFQDVCEAIYNERGPRDFWKVISMFRLEEGPDMPDATLHIISDSWNYFPHKSLGGKSPVEIMIDYRFKQ